jgi:hypothetical protein
MTGRQGWSRWSVALAVVGVVGLGACESDGPAGAAHTVYFVGNVYEGVGGMRLDKTAITGISITYRDKKIKVTIEDSGRFFSVDPLPTWQDYMVTIEAEGYRPFVSRNPGFEVPASLAAMNTGLADIATTQTFTFDAYLFPTGLVAPKATFTVAILDDVTGMPVLNKAAGKARFRPQSQSTLQVGAADGVGGAPKASRRAWANDEDLLTQTITKTFDAGKIDIAEGELSYGVLYEVLIYDVLGYQPLTQSGATGFVAGTVTSKTITLSRALRDPLRITASTATMCTPPVPTAATFSAPITLTFSEEIEIVGTTYAEVVDNGVSIQTVPAFGGCPIKPNVDPTKQERGTKVEAAGATLTFSWNPMVGFTDGMGGAVCIPPTAITSVTYGMLGSISIQPKGDASRKLPLSTMLAQFAPTQVSTSLTCPTLAAP